MKQRTIVIVCIIVLAIAVAVSWRPLVLALVEKQLRGIFADSQIRVGRASGNPLSSIRFSDIKIHSSKGLDLAISYADIAYNLMDIRKKFDLGISLKNVRLSIDEPSQPLDTFMPVARGQAGGTLFLQRFSINDAVLNVRTKDVGLKGMFSFDCDVARRLITALNVSASSLSYNGFQATEIWVTAERGSPAGRLRIGQSGYQKIKVNDIKGKILFDTDVVHLDEITASLFDGAVRGDVRMGFQNGPALEVALKAQDLDITTIIQDLELTEKVLMNGQLIGTIGLTMYGPDIKAFRTSFVVKEPGGALTIKDTHFLENLAKNREQSLSVLMESFRDYQYNVGTIKFFAEGNDLVLQMILDGAYGKRNLNVTVHDMSIPSLLKKEAIE
jgi:hypothetical protein